MTELVRDRRLVSGASTQRSDLLVHALAQLPDEVVLALHTSRAGRPRLEAIARAYGIESRIDFAGDSDGSYLPPFSTMGELVEALSLPDDPPSGCERSGASLDGQRFAPFGQVTSGMEAVDKISPEYGEKPNQGSIQSQGNTYLKAQFPKLDYVKKATIEK